MPPNRFSKKHRKGLKLSSGTMQTVLSAYAKLREMHPSTTKINIYTSTSDDTGVGPRTAIAFKREAIPNDGVLRAPTGKHPREVGTRCHAVTDYSFVLTALRFVVHAFFRRNAIAIVRKIQRCSHGSVGRRQNHERTQLFYCLPTFTRYRR